jgi:hypothetical protein
MTLAPGLTLEKILGQSIGNPLNWHNQSLGLEKTILRGSAKKLPQGTNPIALDMGGNPI